MYCKNCGKEMDDNANVCINCGFAKNTGTNYCRNCGSETVSGAAICTNCGFSLANDSNGVIGGEGKSKLVAGLLAIFLGAFGVHNFYLGNTKKAIIQLVICLAGSLLFGIGALAMEIWGIIEGIQILTGKITTDAQGNPLQQ